MNWKEHINLFANEKFQVRFDQDHAQYNLEGEVETLDAELLFALERCGTDCTLIARPVSSMTDEELGAYWHVLLRAKGRVPAIERITKNARIGALESREFLYLLTIGVYPFDQKAFEDGTVIVREG